MRGRKPLAPVDPTALPEALREAVLDHRRVRSDVTAAQRELRLQRREITVALRAAGYSTRQVAGLLGVSHQRVSQLAPPPTAEERT